MRNAGMALGGGVLALMALVRLGAQPAGPLVLAVAVDQPGAPIASTMYGIFFEDINFAADGGIYAEKIKNRSFEFPDPLMGWKRAAVDGARGSFAAATEVPPSPANARYLRITSEAGRYGVTNDGFRGMGIRKGERYTVSLLARRRGDGPTSLVAQFEDPRNQAQGETLLNGLTTNWARYRGTITATETSGSRTRFRVLADGPGTFDIDMVSVFPEDTWQGRENGLRRDLVQLLKDMKPGFLRFPGGCIVEGRFLDGRYQWKTTIGDPAERTLIVNRWNDEFANRATPDYYQSFGLGFYEYFLLSEDLGAEPLPIINCGMACQYNSGELAPLDAIDPYIRDALDLIEFANGPVTSSWGAKRAALGHPAPFNLKLLGVGNEQWGPQYIERFALFEKVLGQQHPEITLIASADPNFRSANFSWQSDRLRELNADFIDEHFYQPPDWFLKNVGRYDSYPRTGPRIFVGEYAAHVPATGPQNMRPSTLEAALAEAVFMTGFERNADVVRMSAFAPLLAHVDAWQWTPNLIWFDNLRSFGTPSYHAQQMFGANRGARVLPMTLNGNAVNGTGGVFSSAALSEGGREVIVKLVNPGGDAREVAISFGGRTAGGEATSTTLTGDSAGENSLAQPARVAPTTEKFAVTGTTVIRALPARSLTVLRLPLAPR
ncbi:MAG: alpha-L-arabinofuranosidase [Vicinamibacteria bacterium]|nr:alpha-L-arabinofuranosidase [Vicinamibacteria bacterium]